VIFHVSFSAQEDDLELLLNNVGCPKFRNAGAADPPSNYAPGEAHLDLLHREMLEEYCYLQSNWDSRVTLSKSTNKDVSVELTAENCIA
jgi:hypothetical protein